MNTQTQKQAAPALPFGVCARTPRSKRAAEVFGWTPLQTGPLFAHHGLDHKHFRRVQ